MSRAVLDPEFWRERLRLAMRHNDPRQAIYQSCDPERWNQIDAAHRAILEKHLGPETSVIDVGCGFGRLLTLTPSSWKGAYMGIDLSPDFVEVAKKTHPWAFFAVADARTMPPAISKWDLAVAISIRGMLEREVPGEWDKVQAAVLKTAKKLLVLEYSPEDPGTLIGE